MAVQMELSRILICEFQDLQIIELQEKDGQRRFPILIGLGEAEAIRRRLQGIEVKRPLTHDLMANIISSLGGVLESITINDLNDHTFYARLDIMCSDGSEVGVDARPSDAIALGIANEVPIYVEEHVLEDAQNEL